MKREALLLLFGVLLSTGGLAADRSLTVPPKVATSWGFLTNHALVLLHVSRHPESTGLQIAASVLRAVA